MSHTVLICDDTMFMRMVIRRILEVNGYRVIGEAESGSDAVAKYVELRPDVVTMDVVMPDQSGIEAIRRIRELDPHACVVMCSALGQDQLVNEARSVGAAGFLVKPFQPVDLVATMGQALAGRATSATAVRAAS